MSAGVPKRPRGLTRLPRLRVRGDQALTFGAIDRTGADGVHSHADQAPLKSQDAGHLVDTRFGGTGMDLIPHGYDGLRRCDMNDAGAGLAQVREASMHHVE